MPTKPKPTPPRPADKSAAKEYRGRRAKTGNSLGFRFDHALFRGHPEFSGEVIAQVIAPGRMLVSVVDPVAERTDPVMAAFLAFLGSDIAGAPEAIRPMAPDLAARIDELVKGVRAVPDEPLGDESLL